MQTSFAGEGEASLTPGVGRQNHQALIGEVLLIASLVSSDQHVLSLLWRPSPDLCLLQDVSKNCKCKVPCAASKMQH